MKPCQVAIVGLAILAVASVSSRATGQTDDSNIGYPSVAAAMQSLRARPDVKIFMQSGWTMAEDRANLTLWSFPPKGDPAYPAAVKRKVVQGVGGISVNLKVLCGGTRAACEKLVEVFTKLNDSANKHFSRLR